MAVVSCGFHGVKSLCGIRNPWRVKVKLVRIWNRCAVATLDDPFATQMLLVDEEGDRIEATVQKHNMKKFANVMVEGHVYKITNFGVMRNTGNFRACAHEFKIVFNANMKIIIVPNAAIPSMGFCLVKTSDITKTSGRSQFLLDFMGIVTGVSEEINLNKQGRATRLMLLDMVDEMGNIRCAVFGQLVDTILGFLALPRQGLLVVIIQLGRVNLYKGEVGLQNVMNATKIWWNPDIPIAVEFKNSLAVHEIETDVVISLIADRAWPVSMSDEFLQLYPRKNAGQLHEMEGFFIVLATIKEIVEEELWWYTACTCLKAVNFSRGFPYCDDCKRPVFDLSPRYRIKVLVSDGDDCAHFIMFDSECFSLLNKSCRDLLADSKGEDSAAYPYEILNFIWMELLFRIKRKEDPNFGYDDSFRVRRICSESSIISGFTDNIDDETPLKLKFAPPFTKVGHSEPNGTVMEVSSHGNSSFTEIEVSPISCAPITCCWRVQCGI
ncbi:hypothetical protein SESBI_48918 [Sesbania bispinosa]|nr:hypothetical protein SESBI_48918 [Sesbania bispinosa]